MDEKIESRFYQDIDNTLIDLNLKKSLCIYRERHMQNALCISNIHHALLPYQQISILIVIFLRHLY